MNWKMLYGGAASMILVGLVLKHESFVAVGIGLMWIGMSVKCR